jgi:phosphatidylserine/phosphatidylglycerophosphate/cardiolipin synthase-like enzyme
MTIPDSRLPGDAVVTATADRREVVLQAIRQARSNLALSLYRCNDKDVFAELKRARARGVTVDVLVTSRSGGGKKRLRKLWRALEDTGVSVHAHTDPVVKYHAKYLVADDGPALVASLNFTRKCFAKTIDAIVVTWDPAVVAGLRSLIAADRGDAAMPVDLSPRLIVGPERARRQFTAIIEQARTSIRLIDRKASDPALMSLLRERSDAGVQVDVYDGKRLCDLRSHGKIMLVDDTHAVVGGLSLNAMSLDFRREVAVTVSEPAAVAQVVRLFEGVERERPPRRTEGSAAENTEITET